MLAPRMARQETFKSHPSTLEWPILSDGFQAVCTACGRIPALGPKERRYSALVKAYYAYEYVGEDFTHLILGIWSLRFGICSYCFDQFFDTPDYSPGHRFMVRHSVVCKDKEYMQLLIFGDDRIQAVLVSSPCLYHQPPDTVALYGAAKFLFGYRKPGHYGRCYCICWAGCCHIKQPYRKNRKRFPCPEKRINMLLSLEPLVCFESITNGEKF